MATNMVTMTTRCCAKLLAILTAVITCVTGDCPTNSRQKTVNCLRVYFNDTNQDLPQDFLNTLTVQSGDFRFRRQAPHQRARRDKPEINPEWCRYFTKQLDCYGSLHRACPDSSLISNILCSYHRVYGGTICGRTIVARKDPYGDVICEDELYTSAASESQDSTVAIATTMFLINRLLLVEYNT